MLPAPQADEENALSFLQAGEENDSAFPQAGEENAVGSTPTTISQLGGCDRRRRNGHYKSFGIIGINRPRGNEKSGGGDGGGKLALRSLFFFVFPPFLKNPERSN